MSETGLDRTRHPALARRHPSWHGASLLKRRRSFSMEQRTCPEGIQPPIIGIHHVEKQAAIPRSIPAHAGETPRCQPPATSPGVDPRSRGGDMSTDSCAPPQVGRSPLTRGRLLHHVLAQRRQRSIPAHAGETPASPATYIHCRVDPRSRGGDDAQEGGDAGPRGRSPLTRGRPVAQGYQNNELRSIPAHAGETRAGCKRWWPRAVDPRSRGGDSRS